MMNRWSWAFLERMLSQCGFAIRVAYDGNAAVSLARDFRPDCVLTGVVMPKMDGFEEAKEILKLLPACKFIVMSGSAHMPEIREAHARLGLDQRLLLAKPFTFEELLSALRLVGFNC
ncbi:MAG TPA: response regulator [Terriglobales bacterium]|nr:response regulator [Terriglobales bacterium]